MKKVINLITVLFLMFMISNSYAQEMNQEAAKLFNEGNDKLKAGNYNGAIQNYDDALNIEKDYRIYYQKGMALKKANKLEDAKNSFEESIKLKPDFEPGYNALGSVYFSMGNMESAVTNFEKVLTIADDNNTKTKVKKNLSFAYAKMGNNALSNGNTNKAIEYLQKAVENSNYDAAYLSLAKVYSETGEYDKSIEAAQNALKYKSSIGSGGPYYYMGVAYKNKGDNEKAKEMLNLAKSDATYKKLVEYELSLLQ